MADLGEESPDLKWAHAALMEACGLCPNSAHAEEQRSTNCYDMSSTLNETHGGSPEQQSFNPPADSYTQAVPFVDTSFLSAAIPSLFQNSTIFPSPAFSTPLPRFPVDSSKVV